MKNLYITGIAGSGKTAIALGLALKLKKEGYRVNYFKPVGNQPVFRAREDMDARLVHDILNLTPDLSDITPFAIGTSYLSGHYEGRLALRAIMEAYQVVSRDVDLVIIDGATFHYAGASLGLDVISLAPNLNASILNIIRLENDLNVDQAIYFNKYCKASGLEIVGNIFNNVQPQQVPKTKGVFVPILESMGFASLGVVPVRPEIASPTVSEYFEVLEGELLTGEDRLELLVEEVVVGAMTTESAIKHLRRSANKAVVMGGDRVDLALAALETGTSVLILTGGLYPDVKVICRAKEKRVPIILVFSDTYTTIEKISEITRRIRPTDNTGINIALENIERHCEWERILNSLK